MPSQSEYGKAGDETQLVPGSLITYRHFTLRYNAALTPMSGGWDDTYQHPGPLPFEARCRRRDFPSMAQAWGNPYGPPPMDPPPMEPHDSPDIECRCGFYAHYSPAGDFYEHDCWSAAELSGSGGVGLYGTSPFFGLIMVRSVVEMSGRVVMGSKGVRAQKMKIKALSVDWAKNVDVCQHRQNPQYRLTGDLKWLSVNPYFDAEIEQVPVEERIPTAYREAVEYLCRRSAGRYDAQYYESVQEMHEAWPQPDLSALGITPAPEPIKAWGSISIGGQLSNVSISFSQQLTATQKAMRAVAKTLAKALDVPVSLVKEPKPTPFERAIEAKKSRPAPPGSGIDRRKGKLR